MLTFIQVKSYYFTITDKDFNFIHVYRLFNFLLRKKLIETFFMFIQGETLYKRFGTQNI